MNENQVPEIATAELADAKRMVNCPKCSTALWIQSGNFAHLCPVCSQVFRVRVGTKLTKDVSRKTMVEAFVTVDQDDKGKTKSGAVVKNVK